MCSRPLQYYNCYTWANTYIIPVYNNRAIFASELSKPDEIRTNKRYIICSCVLTIVGIELYDQQSQVIDVHDRCLRAPQHRFMEFLFQLRHLVPSWRKEQAAKINSWLCLFKPFLALLWTFFIRFEQTGLILVLGGHRRRLLIHLQVLSSSLFDNVVDVLCILKSEIVLLNLLCLLLLRFPVSAWTVASRRDT